MSSHSTSETIQQFQSIFAVLGIQRVTEGPTIQAWNLKDSRRGQQGVNNSPLKLMQKRTIRGLLPVRQQETNMEDYERYQARKQEQAKYQTGKALPEIAEGSNILFYSERERQWLPGVIVQLRLHDRSYVIISEKGRKVVRNRIDLKPYHKDVHVKFQSSYKRSITAPKASLSYPLTVNKLSSHNHLIHHTMTPSSWNQLTMM